ncbi:MAG: VOC family protein [Chitinophagaceae bacterium]|nr:VOC family protein [Chitinophagaceae bacterium]
MKIIHPYLIFNGNCKEAMTFYKKCLGGKLELQTISESPLATNMPQKMKDCILHATLTINKLVLMGSDMVPQPGLIKGNAVSLMLDCKSEEEIKDYYKKLSADGQATHPLEKTFFGSTLGGLTDKFGNHWLLHFKKNKK